MKPEKPDKETILKTISVVVDYVRNFDPLVLTYFPFIGWFIPMLIRKDDEFYMFHAKQGFVISVYVIAACSLLYYFAHIFLPSWMDIPRFILVMLIYLHYIVYATVCVLGTLMIRKGEKKGFPFIDRYVTKFTALLNF